MSSKFRLYTIHPNRGGYSDVNPVRRIVPRFTNRLEFVVRFDESVKYQAINSNYDHQYDFHKLNGLKEALTGGRDNSGRPGFRWCHEQLEFAPYVHYWNKDLKKTENLGAKDPAILYTTANVKEEIHCTVEAVDGFYNIAVNGRPAAVARGVEGPFFWWCYPFAQIQFAPGEKQPVRVMVRIL